MGALDPDKYQELLNARDELDDVPVSITRHQAQKCATIITAGQAGHTAYTEATDVVARDLQAIAVEVLPGTSRIPTGSAALWRILEDLQWPAPGPPADQAS